MIRGTSVLVLLVGVGSAAFRRGNAQDRLTVVVNRAQDLQQAGSWKDGRALLASELARCRPGKEGSGCRGLVLSALGYLHQRQAQKQPAEERDFLSVAANYYRDALKENGQDGASLQNLVLTYKGLGRDADLRRLLEVGLRTDSANAAFYALLLGESYEDEARWDRAAAVYRRGIAASDDESLRRRLVEAYRELPEDSVVNLYHLVSASSDWESRFPDASARAYELVVSRLARRDRATAVPACMRWIGTLAGAQLLSGERLDAIGESWLTPVLAELKTFLEDPRRPPTNSFWRESGGQGREVLGRVALALGRERSTTGEARAADAYWQMGMEIAEGPPATPVTLDLAMEAAGLYQRRPELDPDGRKFRRLERQLFEEKSRAYDVADKDAIQQLHTVLGLIYAERRVLTSSPPWTNATYQLERALSTARERDSESGAYQPLPHLRARLAEAYAGAGRNREAAASYVAAAQAYLDSDDPQSAAAMLQRGSTTRGAQPEETIRALHELIRARARESASDSRPTADACDEAAQRATVPAKAAGVDAAFLRRQRFKLLADCVVGGRAPVRPADAARVVNLIARDRIPLVGAGDLLRLEQSQAAIKRVLRLPSESPTQSVNFAASGRGTSVRVQLFNDSRPRYVPLSADALVGSKVVEQLGADTAVRTVRVREGRVTVVTGAVSAADRERIQATVKNVGGVESARVYENPEPEVAPASPPGPPPGPGRLLPGPPPPLVPVIPMGPPPPPIQPMQEGPAASKPIAPFPPAPPAIAPPKLKVEDSSPALRAAIAAYARALESRDLEAVRRVVPKFDVDRLRALFARAESLEARLSMASFSVDSDRATAVISGELHYQELRVPRRQRINQRATFARGSRGEWRMTSVQ